MKIRNAKKEDYADIIKLYKQLYASEKIYDSNIIDEYKIDNKEEKVIKNRIQSRKELLLVAMKDKKVVGLIDGYIINSTLLKEKISYIDHLVVDEKYRNQKIATELINEFINKSKKKNAKYIKLCAFKNNEKAINLYKKFDFLEYSTFYTKKI